MTPRTVCSRCSSDEPFHVHDGDRVIEDSFTIGRGLTEFQAALEWKRKYIAVKRELDALREPTVTGSGLKLCGACRAPLKDREPIPEPEPERAEAAQPQTPATKEA